MVMDAAKATINTALEGSVSLAEATKADVMSGKAVFAAIQNIDSLYAGRAEGNDLARRAIMIATWINQNFEQMSEAEKHVAWYQYISPIRNQRFNMARNGDIEPEGDDAGKPYSWDAYVQEQLKRMRAPASVVQGYGGVQNESVEDQIDRIDALLKEKDDSYDLRLYSIKIDISIQSNVGGEAQETQTEIRGIEGVTTVRPIGDTKDVGSASVATYEIKFELLGNIGRVQYRDRVLIPGLMKIKGLKILRVSSVHRTNVRGTIRTVRETLQEYGFGGMVANLGAMRTGSGPIRTPRSSLLQVANDWAENGVMDYDRPMNSTEMQYHVMVPVEEFLNFEPPLMSRVHRSPKPQYDSDYQHFIKNGPQGPVYVAIGKNGRVKVTGGEDILWFAKQSGLEEVPVFFSYQRQV